MKCKISLFIIANQEQLVVLFFTKGLQSLYTILAAVAEC